MKVLNISTNSYLQKGQAKNTAPNFKGNFLLSKETFDRITTKEVSADVFRQLRGYAEKKLPDVNIDWQEGKGYVLHGEKDGNFVKSTATTFLEAWNSFLKKCNPDPKPKRTGPFPTSNKG